MVDQMLPRKFANEEDGGTLAEGLAVFPIIVLVIAVCVEFGFAMYQWNMGAKAMQLGVRKLTVSEPVHPNYATVFDIEEGDVGELITPDASVRAECGAGTDTECDAELMQRLVNGGEGGAWKGLNKYFPNLMVQDIRVSYELSGLGYHGRPDGPVVTVRMELNRNAIDLPVTGKLLDVLNIGFPPFAVTATSEDMQSCPDGCPSNG